MQLKADIKQSIFAKIIELSVRFKRINLRIKLFNITLFIMFAKTQTLEGMTSLQDDGKHIVMWDLENCTLNKAKAVLKKVQKKYNLADINIVSDFEGSYRAWCYTKVDFNTLIKILADCLCILDYNFFYYTIKRKKATLRTNSKVGRPAQKVVCVLKSYSVPFVEDTIEKVDYDTGVAKRGISLFLGGE